ncbi:VanW family protein [Desulfosporosinus hippei]|uniref:Vancomycin resistance protein YoaR, contains peptidoglycan-binding and VanW domains n=1 Tax=Desulfosporosinus hippei DSM 8344 TaxID=1121419 RepID=A0A1G8GE38_9FIRM|nr:VanW family protein [Desulfosporosinus hippei]SDH92639.1 Vancomycin resistance protein YoaR, contains peptidoglycan-binding and VanW domains [Desulfosporosinus hippei DSM 8344]
MKKIKCFRNRRLSYLFILSILFTSLLSGCNSLDHTPDYSPSPVPDKQISQDKQEAKAKTLNSVMPEGSKIDDLDLSGTPLVEASTKIENWAKDKLEETRVLLYNNTEIPLTLTDIGFEVDTEKTIDQTQTNPGTIQPSVFKVNSEVASQKLQEKLTKFNTPAKDAAYKIEKDKVVIQPSEPGRRADVEHLISKIENLSLSEVPTRIEIPMSEVAPAVTTESIKDLAFDSIIGEFSTNFLVKEKNRSANLTAAAKALDGKLLQPGETLSFNQVVGPREPGTGYKEAYVFINGEYVKGTGGGICQVSSTLYNAVLLSNLEIVERMPHAVVVGYVPPGQDATVNYPNIDFKFKNNSQSLAYLRTEVKSGVLTVRIWGKKTGNTVRIERQVEREIPYTTKRRLDPKLPKGRVVRDQGGVKGIVVNTWQVIRDESGSETKKFLGRDSYAPTNRIFRVGT